MNTYILFALRISRIDGLLQYFYNKIRYLESRGWRVLVFSGQHGPILIDDFKRFEKYIYSSLGYMPSSCRKSEVDDTIEKIVKDVGLCDGDKCIIESSYFPLSVWAEIVASRLKCRHLTFLLQEEHNYDSDMKKFLRFKYDRHELAGITRNSIKDILGDAGVELRDDTHIKAYCNNVIIDSKDNYSGLLDKSADITLGTLGRLVKPCVPAIIEGFCSFAVQHPDKKINVVVMGGPHGRKKETSIKEKLDRCPNVSVVMTGDIYPVPQSFAHKIDVYVSTAGAATATYRAGIPTIKVNPLNGEPVGVIGLDFINSEKTMYDSDPHLTISDCIERALRNRDKIEFVGGLGESYENQMVTEFDRHLSIANTPIESAYYDEDILLKFKSIRNHHFPLLHSILMHVLGCNGYEKVMANIKRFL